MRDRAHTVADCAKCGHFAIPARARGAKVCWEKRFCRVGLLDPILLASLALDLRFMLVIPETLKFVAHEMKGGDW